MLEVDAVVGGAVAVELVAVALELPEAVTVGVFEVFRGDFELVE